MSVRVQAVLTHRVSDFNNHGFHGFHLSTQGRMGCLKQSREFLASEGEATDIHLGGGDLLIYPVNELSAFIGDLRAAGHRVVLEVSQIHLGLPKLDTLLTLSGVKELVVGLHCFSQPHVERYVAETKRLKDRDIAVTPCVHIGRTEVMDALYLALQGVGDIIVRKAVSGTRKNMEEWKTAYANNSLRSGFAFDRSAARHVGADTSQPLTLHYDAVSHTYSDEHDGERFPAIPGIDSLVAVEYLIVADDSDLSHVSWRNHGEHILPEPTQEASVDALAA